MNFTAKTRYLRLPFVFDVARLHADLEKIGEADWVAHGNTAAYEGIWRCAPLRSVNGRPDHILSVDGENYADTALLDRCPGFREVIERFECDMLSVRLMALAPGSRITPHRDRGTSFASGIARLHVPIATTPEVLFSVEDEEVHFAAGHTWYLNADCLHGVYNASRQPRVHLMLDCVVNPWLEQVFRDAGYQPDAAPKYGDPSITDDNVAEVIAGLQALGCEAGDELAARLAALHGA